MRDWPARRWVVATLAAAGTVLLIGIPTALVPTGMFARGVPAPGWAWPVLIVTALLSGLLMATYIAHPDATPMPEATGDPGQLEADEQPRTIGGMVGTVLAYVAVGCPTCNKVALLALGSGGAIRWFAPLQPAFAALGIVLLLYALRRRLAGEKACPIRT